MLAIVDMLKRDNGEDVWLVRDGTTDKDSHVFCCCDHEADAEAIASSLNACHRLYEAGRLIHKNLPK